MKKQRIKRNKHIGMKLNNSEYKQFQKWKKTNNFKNNAIALRKALKIAMTGNIEEIELKSNIEDMKKRNIIVGFKLSYTELKKFQKWKNTKNPCNNSTALRKALKYAINSEG